MNYQSFEDQFGNEYEFYHKPHQDYISCYYNKSHIADYYISTRRYEKSDVNISPKVWTAIKKLSKSVL